MIAEKIIPRILYVLISLLLKLTEVDINKNKKNGIPKIEEKILFFALSNLFAL
jgi:hypothetical protein